MNFTTTVVTARVPVTILHVHGDLDRLSYESLIARAQDLYQQGVRHILLDMTEMPYMSSAGLIALHGVDHILSGEPMPDPEFGWEAFHHLADERDAMAASPNLKLLNPSARVNKTLEMTGLNQFFQIFTDQASALAAF